MTPTSLAEFTPSQFILDECDGCSSDDDSYEQAISGLSGFSCSNLDFYCYCDDHRYLISSSNTSYIQLTTSNLPRISFTWEQSTYYN